jgi:alginate O-acetyltransferase complex protein AlgI
VGVVSLPVFIFFVLFVLIYWVLPRKWQNLYVIGYTFAFISYFSFYSALALAAITGFVYAIARVRSNQARWILLAISLLSVFFIIYKIQLSTDVNDRVTSIFLLGFSFYILRAIHYLADTYKHGVVTHLFSHFVGYMFFLPTIVVGPINRFNEFVRENERRRWDGRLVSLGLERILYGYAKVIVLANYYVGYSLGGYISSLGAEQAAWASYLECVQYGLNLYLQFSGYSDIAIGFALLLGLRISENFNYPFFRKNISEFWRSWHISLTSWCRDYIYISVMAFSRQPYLAILSSMVILGIWHEFSLRYLLWGLYHGTGIVIWQYFQSIKSYLPKMNHPLFKKIGDTIAYIITLNFVMLSFAITKDKSLVAAWQTYMNIFNLTQ